MISFTINGKDYSGEDMNLMICYDSVKDFAEVKMFCDYEEIQLDDNNAEIDISVNIKSNGLLEKVESNKDIKARADLINRALVLIKRELAEIVNPRHENQIAPSEKPQGHHKS